MENPNNFELSQIIFEKYSTVENQENRLKARRSIYLPNEIWLKIINYMKTKDIFGSFALVNKHFNFLTPEISAIKYLQIKNIAESISKYESIMKLLSGCKNMVEFSIEEKLCDKYQFMSCIIKALESSEKLKSLKISTKHNINPELRYGFGHKIEAISSKFLEHLEKMKDKLEHLEFEKIIIRNLHGLICKMKNLKSLSIKNRDQFDDQFIENLGNSENQLEKIEWNQILLDSKGKVEKAFNNLLFHKQDTLKSIKIVYSNQCYGVVFSKQMSNLSFCQNLEEFTGSLYNSHTKYLSSLQNLKILNIEVANVYASQNENGTLLHGMKLPKLKNLSVKLYGVRLSNQDCCPILARNHFPKLEKLYVYSSDIQARFETKHFESFVAQSPNLKIVEFDGYLSIDIANEYLYKIIKDRSIFVIFSRNLEKQTIRNLLDPTQSSLEEFLREDTFVHAKYQTMKKQYLIQNCETFDKEEANFSKPKVSTTLSKTWCLVI